ncbi:hypothetical protein [Bacillus pseudomycoides]|uniref:hypothetical protein n=1 Tax=Bacillus pseudomycoides TaxID=64104 RepID=UPI000330F74D|nr:hypothetical protein [Bacillus pseudomycoides]EOP49071.1 hypothetical protein IIW_05325 [Bacillus cereus VD136]EOP63331.1 hypothetical protein KOW_05474 [Bacillus cereus VDM006]PEL29449.1 hypothetical protein CN608_09830 [Bacillus pseudomycoides]
MTAREKISVRLDPDVVGLGRRLAKIDFGSEQKFGMLIEHAIKSYNARQIKSTDVGGILSETESALIDRLESRFDEMSKRTVERMAGLLFTNTFDTVRQSLLIEQLHKAGIKNSDTLQNEAYKQTTAIVSKRYKEFGDNLLFQQKAQIHELKEQLEDMTAKHKKAYQQWSIWEKSTKETRNQLEKSETNNQQLQKRIEQLESTLQRTTLEKKHTKKWAQNLVKRIENSGMIDRPKKLLEAHISENGAL